MTIEEKAKAYDEALERAKAYHRNELAGSRKEMTEYIFPELRESEDERIRKAIIELLKEVEEDETYTGRQHIPDMLSYLEKQKEQKPILKFRIGDTIRKKAQPTWIKQITSIFEDKTYITGIGTDAYGIKVSEQDDWELVEQKPEIKYVYPKFRKGDVIEPITPNGSFTPVRVVGIWDGSYSCRSDDDKAYLSFPIKLEDEYRLVEPKPAEWSEEDEILRIRTINRLETLNFHGISGKEIRESIDWLKSLRPNKQD